MPEDEVRFRYPRRQAIRAVLRALARAALGLLTDLRIVGQENCPREGPLLVVANHFSYMDPVLMVRVAPWPLDFWGGFRMPHAPAYLTWIPKMWGYYAVRRGGFSRQALRAGEAVLRQRGILGVFPEAGNWATVLRHPRPGAAFLATRTATRLLPMGFDGLLEVFSSLRRGRRARVTVRIGPAFGPLPTPEEGPEYRQRLDEVGDEIMRHIAPLVPPEKRGVFADDPEVRAAAERLGPYPWARSPEG